MSQFVVEGGRCLQGTIRPKGSKNEALQVICAALLTDRPVVLKNVPDIVDVRALLELLSTLGVDVTRTSSDAYRLDASDAALTGVDPHRLKTLMGTLRGSLMIVGPLVARFGEAYLCKPGGDKIGRRRIDVHLQGLEQLGVRFTYESADDLYTAKLKASCADRSVILEEASVTATANVLMTAARLRAKTTIYNAACEPHVQQLCQLLSRMGARIEGMGSNLLTVHGRDSLEGAEHELLPDLIEVGSFIGLAAITRSSLTIEGVHMSQLRPVLHGFQKLGIEPQIQGDDLFVDAQPDYRAARCADGSLVTLSDGIWPSFPADLLSVALVVATRISGNVLVHQRMFEGRLFFVDQLLSMGAQIVLCDPHRALVMGLGHTPRLKATSMSSPDIRAGIALLLAALAAEGTSIINGIHQIDRGYERIDERLNALGASIVRRV